MALTLGFIFNVDFSLLVLRLCQCPFDNRFYELDHFMIPHIGWVNCIKEIHLDVLGTISKKVLSIYEIYVFVAIFNSVFVCF